MGRSAGRVIKAGSFGLLDPNKDADRLAGAAQGAAMAQQREAGAAFRQFKEGIEPATTKSLAQQDQAIAAQERNLGRLEKLAAEIDPAVIEASQQALALLRGEESKTLSPVRKQREMGRQKLLNTLRERLGPGAETSSAGMQALNAFDAETDQLLAGAQQSALGQLGNLTTQFRAAGPDLLRQAGGLASLSQGRFGTQLQASQGLFDARRPMMGAAGSQFTGQMVRAQQGQALTNSLFQLGGMAAGAALGGGGGAGAQIGGQLGSIAAGGPAFDPSKLGNLA